MTAILEPDDLVFGAPHNCALGYDSALPKVHPRVGTRVMDEFDRDALPWNTLVEVDGHEKYLASAFHHGWRNLDDAANIGWTSCVPESRIIGATILAVPRNDDGTRPTLRAYVQKEQR